MALIRLYTVVSRAGDGDAHPASRFPARGPPTGPLVAAVLNSGCIFTRTRYLLGLPRLLLGSPSSRASCLVGLGSCWPLRRRSLSSSSGGPCHMCAMLPPGHIHILVTLIFSSDFLGFFLFMLQTGCFVPSYFAAHRSSRPLWPCSQDVIFFFFSGGGGIPAVWRSSAHHTVGSRCCVSVVRVPCGSALPSSVRRRHHSVRFPRIPEC